MVMISPVITTTKPAPAESRTSGVDPIKALLDKQRRNEPLTPNEQALIDLLAKDDTRG